MKESSLHSPGTLLLPQIDSFLYEKEDDMFLMLVGGGSDTWRHDQVAVTLGHESHDGKFFDILLGGRILWVRTDRSYHRASQ